jgi:hypothetical protein
MYGVLCGKEIGIAPILRMVHHRALRVSIWGGPEQEIMMSRSDWVMLLAFHGSVMVHVDYKGLKLL